MRLAASGAAKLSLEVAEQCEHRLGVTISEGYGLTEASPVVTTASGIAAKPGSIGLPLPGVRLRLVDADGDDVLVGDAGEIWVQGPNVFVGYWNDAEATARALTPDGWLRTGDIAVVDDDGALYLVDRAKDLIIVSGFNVYPAEVEDVILEHPAVEGCAVVGVAHPYSGESVKAYVVLAPGQTVEEDSHHRVLHRTARPLQVPREGDVRRRTTNGPRRQDPPPRPPLKNASTRNARGLRCAPVGRGTCRAAVVEQLEATDG